MQVILSGLHGDDTEESVREVLKLYFKVVSVTMIRDGINDSPWALVEVPDAYERVWNVCNQLRGVFHRGRPLSLRIPIHQDALHLQQ